jgi:mRNA interferase RelE/StbE
VSYTVVIGRRAQASLGGLPARDDARIRDAMRELRDNPRPSGCRKLTGRDGWRLRAGDYRVIYEIDDAARVVRVIAIGHRRDVYR